MQMPRHTGQSLRVRAEEEREWVEDPIRRKRRAIRVRARARRCAGAAREACARAERHRL